MTFKSLIAPVQKSPDSAYFLPAGFHNLVRDQLSITSWLAVGAVIEGLLVLLLGKVALAPIVLLLGYRLTDTFLILNKAKENPRMKDTIKGKTAAQIPNEIGGFSGKAADGEIVVLLIGTRNNHPLGMLAPGGKTMGDFFESMAKVLDEHREEFDFLGHTCWLSRNQRDSSNEVLDVCYFKTYEGLEKFALSKYHREAWSWWNQEGKNLGHHSIYHEVYCVPAGNWENVYINSHASNFASTHFQMTNEETGEEMWASPRVDASRGLLRTSKGRMSRTNGKDNDELEKADRLNYEVAMSA